MNDTGADSFKSAQGLFKTQGTFHRAGATAMRREEPECCRETKVCCHAGPSVLPEVPLPVKMLYHDAAQRSRRAFKAREARTHSAPHQVVAIY